MRIISYITALVVLSSIASTALAGALDGLYIVSGKDAENGDYQGILQIKDSSATRIVRYRDFKFLDNQVETVWSGNFDGHIIRFNLKPTETLTGFNNFRLTSDQMKTTTLIQKDFTLEQPIKFLNSTETWTLYSKDPGRDLLWKDQRTKISTNGNKANWILQIANFLGIKKVINEYQKLARKSDWSKRPEFQNRQHWAVIDPTDYDFYQKRENVIRVTNKTLNPASLAEATARKNAYGNKLSEKARYFEEETQKYNVNSQGMLEVAITDSKRNKIAGEIEYDSTLWTGIYIWSEVLRYKQTQEAQAYDNIKKSLHGLLLLTQITGDTHQFARTVIESPAAEPPSREGLIQGKGQYSNLKWQQYGNNDMSKGLFIAFISAYSIIKTEDADLKNEIAIATRKLLNYEPIKGKGFNEALTYGLIALYNRDVVALEQYSRRMINIKNFLADAINIDSGFYFQSIADWSGIHLSAISELSNILLARELQENFSAKEGTYWARKSRKQSENCLYEMSATYANAKRDFLTILTYAYSPDARQSVEFKKKALAAIWSLREVPAPRSFGKGEADHTINPNWSISAWPRSPWKSLKGPFKLKKENLTFENHMQGAYMYPIFETTAWTSTYLWKDNPYRTLDIGQDNKVIFSADYLLIYRVAIDAGLITPLD